jgi:hypothetical protein
MTEETKAVFGIFSHRTSFEYAISALKVAGFDATEISTLHREDTGKTDHPTNGHGRAIQPSWLAEPAVFSIQGHGTFLVSGPLLENLNQVAATSKPDGIAGMLRWIGIPQVKTNEYQEKIGNGAIVLAVRCDDPKTVDRAEYSLRSTGADGVCSNGEASSN